MSKSVITIDQIKTMEEYADWPQAFTYLTGYQLRDVDYIINAVEGENDGLPWIAFGQLNNGLFFVLSAGCDYTGWDCQASGSVTYWEKRRDAVIVGMTDEERERFGYELAKTAKGYVSKCLDR